MGKLTDSRTVTPAVGGRAAVGGGVADLGGMLGGVPAAVGGVVVAMGTARRSPSMGSRGWRREAAGKLETATILPVRSAKRSGSRVMFGRRRGGGEAKRLEK
jgi:hypothetical protein